MTCLEIKPVRRARGEVTLPGDKSIAHRALLLSAITKGNTVINNFPFNDDCLATLDVLFKLGVKYKAVPKVKVIIIGKGLRGLDKPQTSLRIKESGTTFRLILGILAGQNFESRVSAGKSLSKRPMLRVTQPLRLMGAGISSRIMKSCAKRQEPRKYAEEYPPILIQGGALKGITYKLPVASAQVKSAILLAGLFTKEVTTVIEPIATRDHTERILKLFKARIKVKGDNIVINGGHELVSPGTIYIPGDISSAAFFIVLAVVLQGSHVKLRNSGLNFKRAGIIRILRRMGAKIKITNLKSRNY
ncbi:MAG: 3-phosphoshikimate 1-carboxyvinyltransferase, partial [Candidatus Omnitrophica bacterium]|nr:3-phosphoshikimate 1-carboxyvinyltransferase [Candidatus Omnitrophota bacterium]